MLIRKLPPPPPPPLKFFPYMCGLQVITERDYCPEVIILDEIHHPSTENWVVLMLVKYIISLGYEVKVLIASATLNAEAITAQFEGAPMIQETHQRAHPLAIKYTNALDKENYATVLQQVPKASQAHPFITALPFFHLVLEIAI